MNPEDEQIIENSVSNEFKKMAHAGFLNKLEKVMSLCSDGEAIYLLNITLKIIKKRFGE